MFTSDSKYYLDNEDQEDRNKIIGIRYGFKKTSPSARFTQWYNPESQLWHIDWYCCVNGITSFAMLCVVPVDKDFKLTLLLRGTHYKFEVRNQGGLLIATKSIEKKHKHWLGILLGPYFGGNRTPKQKHSYKLSKP